MSIELLLDRFGQSNKFRKKSKEKFRDIQQMDIVPKMCFHGRLGDVLRISWGRPKSTFQGRPLDVRLRRPSDAISKRPRALDWGRPWDRQIGSLVDVLGSSEADVLRTSWRPIFAGCVVTELFIRGRKLNISLVSITQSYFAVPKYWTIFYTLFYYENSKQTTASTDCN